MTDTNTPAEYADFLTTFANDLRKLAIDGALPPIAEVIPVLSPTGDNRMIRDLCVELKIATKSEFDREMRRARQREALGTAPSTATELVAAFAAKHRLRARYDGLMTRTVRAEFTGDDGTVLPITPEDRERDAAIDLYASFHCDRRSRLNRLDLERELRIMNSDYRMGFAERDITDAVEEWSLAASRERLLEIFSGANGKEPHFDAPAKWLELAKEVFDCSETSPEFVVAVLRKFVWQVKRKIIGLPIFGHLMPVILGPQGIGKSTLVNRILSPVEELRLNVDFKMITDDRNVDIWHSFVMFLDEMGYASKADVDAVKNIISASTLTRRPMRTNGHVTIDQNATFIGCSNRELGQLIRDPTGIRRFVGLRMRSDANRKLINTIDMGLLWGGVSIEEADPMLAFSSELASQQEDSRERGRVEQWMVDFDGANNAYQAGVNKSGNIPARDLYLAFREYEDEAFPGHYKTSKTDFDYEMARLRKNAPDSVIFEKRRGGTGIMYRWRKESHLRVVD